MHFILFTKHLEGLDIAGIIQALKSVGVQGADLCVRPGYPVTPDNIENALPEAARRFADEGLSIPLVTAPTSFNEPTAAYAERFYAACGEAGVKHIKLGYWHWSPEVSYWDEVQRIRGYLQEFQTLSSTYGVQTVVHNHSGRSMGLNTCAAMNLVDGLDPHHVGIFADPGHLSICGEPIDMAFDIAASYLAVVACKDLVRVPRVHLGESARETRVVRMGEGFVDWRTTLAALVQREFDGPVSLHCEYGGEPTETVVDLARCDLRYVKRVLESL